MISWIAEEEQEVLKRADLVRAGTGKLYEAKKPFARTIHCLLSAVEFEHFHRATRAGQLPAELKRIKEKYRYVAGYFGTLDMRIHQAMLAEAMKQLPEWALVLIGPKVSNFSVLEALPNVFLLGQRPYSTLPDFTRGFNVCLIPFKLDLLTEHGNPTKVLEYFAAGKPVVSTSIPDLKQFYPELIYFADGGEELVKALPEALSSPSREELRKKGLALAAENTWDEAVKKILRLLDLPLQESGG
jgi:UDP-galactopyranose mutase